MDPSLASKSRRRIRPLPFPWSAPTSLTRTRLALIAIFILSVLIRLPHVQDIPTYTDEMRLVKYAVRLSWGEPVPLSLTGYNGPMMIYLLAAFLKLRPDPDTPRQVAVLLGALLPTLTAMICLRRSGLWPSLLAAGLLSTSFSFVVIYGHLAWAVSLGLVFLLLAWLWSLGTARERRPFAALFSYGLALQCYPLLAAFSPWILARHFGEFGISLRRRAGYVALLIAALSPIALHHLLEWVRGEAWTLDSSAPELIADAASIRYRSGLFALLRSIIDAISGAGHAEHFQIAQDPLAVLFAALMIVGLVAAIRRRDGFIVVNSLSFLALTPLLVRQYGFPMGTRYSALCLPLAMLAVAALTPLPASELPGTGKRPATPWKRAQEPAWALLIVTLMLASGQRISNHYREAVLRGRSNVVLDRLVAQAAGDCTPILLDNRIDAEFPAGGGFSRVLEARLNLYGIRPHRADDAIALQKALVDLSSSRRACAILSEGHLAQIEAASSLQELQTIAVLPASEYGEGVRLLRVH